MNVLVAYASKRGGTEGIAKAIGDAFADLGIHADVASVKRADPGSGYDAVVVGSALYMFRWRWAARSFVRRNTTVLKRLPVWLFSTGPLDDSAVRDEIPPVRGVTTLMNRVHARGHKTFGGRLLPTAKGFPASAMAKTHAGDWRNWTQIREWVGTIGEELGASVAVTGTATPPVAATIRL